LLVIMLFVYFVVLPPRLWAEDKPYDHQIKVFESAAKALHQYHPDIAAKLTEYAHDQISWREETDEDRNEAANDKAVMLTMKVRQAYIKLLRDSALFLRHSNPELSKELMVLADKKRKRMLGILHFSSSLNQP